MPVSSAMDGNLGVMRALDRSELPTDSFTSLCLGSGIPAGTQASRSTCV